MNNGSNGQKVKVWVEEEIKRLVPTYIQNRKNDMKAMIELAEREDFDAIQFLADIMIGSGSVFGFEFISVVGQSIQKAATDKNSRSIVGMSNALIRYLDRIEVVYVSPMT
ncbi:MAG: hypothetical protein HY580_04625 [Nitrospinae bacterium]|nr:hypothetical protein [Nitrospinota bacterium]